MPDLTPTERADKVRDGMKRESPRLLADVLVHIPPGSVILTADEVEQIVRRLKRGQADDACLSGRGYDPEPWETALALLAGAANQEES